MRGTEKSPPRAVKGLTKLAVYLARHDMPIAELARKAEVSYQTTFAAVKGQRLKRYEVAARLSRATGGEVTVDDLCS